ncbi:MAG: hypothetical protein LLF76_09230 [Planctomycetaceae bacterium]|nr:hypothetical protein [Planctomycetaceae bacterium]
MSIRREDKEFIQSLAILGALLGLCIGSFLVMHLSDQAHKAYAQQSEYRQTQEALIKLSTTTVTPNNPIANKEVFDQVQQQIQQQDSRETAQKSKSFWLSVPRMGFWALCAGGGLAGAVSGYTAIWLTAWICSLIVYQFLRLLYAVIRKASPSCPAAVVAQPGSDAIGDVHYQRNDKRILPMVVKLFFFLILILVLLTVVVWRLTNL